MDFKITGLDEVQRKLDRMAKAASPQETARRMAALRCPEHGEAPANVRVLGDEVSAEFCCEQARDQATKAYGDAIKRSMR